jgi:hypothetical protein
MEINIVTLYAMPPMVGGVGNGELMRVMGMNNAKIAILLTTLVATINLVVQNAEAATVSCSFMSETEMTRDGRWIRSEVNFMKLAQTFGDGFKMNLQNSLISNLDTKQPFLAGEVQRGRVYLRGAEMGVEGKVIYVNETSIIVYDGMCQVGFGK